MAYTIERKDRFYVVAYDGAADLFGRLVDGVVSVDGKWTARTRRDPPLGRASNQCKWWRGLIPALTATLTLGR